MCDNPFVGAAVTNESDRERLRRETATQRIIEALTESAKSLSAACEWNKDSVAEQIITACAATQLVVELMLRAMVLDRDFGHTGYLKYPGLHEWFEQQDAKRSP
jgi:hypothetical protein